MYTLTGLQKSALVWTPADGYTALYWVTQDPTLPGIGYSSRSCFCSGSMLGLLPNERTVFKGGFSRAIGEWAGR